MLEKRKKEKRRSITVTPRLLQKGVSEIFFRFPRDITNSSEL
jgi:hypothetical protein